MHKHSVNRRLREDLSPVRSPPHGRSASSPSSASSREGGSRRYRQHSRSPARGSRSDKRSWDSGYRKGHGDYLKHDANNYRGSYGSYGYDNLAPSKSDDYNQKRGPPGTRDEYPAKRARRNSRSPSRNESRNTHRDQDFDRRPRDTLNAALRSPEGPKPYVQVVNAAVQGKHVTPLNHDESGEAKTVVTGLEAATRAPAANGLHSKSSDSTQQKAGNDGAGSPSTIATVPVLNAHEDRAAIIAEDVDKPPESRAQHELTAEERRKRREAIRAKFQSPSTDLRVQALHQNVAESLPREGHRAIPENSGDSIMSPSPRTDVLTSAVSPKSSPHTPDCGSAVDSPEPVAVTSDAELANAPGAPFLTGDNEEPSAADYDPTVDMQEDRLRHHKRLQDESRPATMYDEIKAEDHQVPVPNESMVNPSANATAKEKAPEDDMFASEDEDNDDMFAGQPAHKVTRPSSQPDKSLSKSKEIDTSMLENWDDPDGYYKPILGEIIDGRYQVQTNLGKGMFSGVVRAVDQQSNEMKAIKVIRNNESMVKAAQKEMGILEKLSTADPEDRKHVVRLERSFMHRGHLCMAFENLSLDLRAVLKKFGRDVGINIKAIRSYAQQIFLALSLMRKCNILHADLKPDNMLVNEDRTSLKVCDLGSAADATEFDIAPYLVSRFYRAPEVIIGCQPDFAMDVWSVGCTLFELFTGKILFTGRNNNQMLRSIMETRGKLSIKLLKKGEFGAVHFDDANLYFRSVETDKATGREMVKLINFQKPTRELKERVLAAAPKGIKEGERKELLLFADLLDKCLMLNPEKRITPAEALKHPFVHRPSMAFGSR